MALFFTVCNRSGGAVPPLPATSGRQGGARVSGFITRYTLNMGITWYKRWIYPLIRVRPSPPIYLLTLKLNLHLSFNGPLPGIFYPVSSQFQDVAGFTGQHRMMSPPPPHTHVQKLSYPDTQDLHIQLSEHSKEDYVQAGRFYWRRYIACLFCNSPPAHSFI